MKADVSGVFALTFYIDVNETVVLDEGISREDVDESEILEAAQNELSAGRAYLSEGKWLGDSPVIEISE